MAYRVHEIYSAPVSNKPNIIDSFLKKECSLGATCSLFAINPLQLPLVLSSLQIPSSQSGKLCVVVDLSYPPSLSVNSGIQKDTSLNEPFSLRLPGTSALQAIIKATGLTSSKKTSASHRSPQLQLPQFKWRPFYEAKKGVEIFGELYASTHAIHAFHDLQADLSPFFSLSLKGVGVDNAMRDYWG